MKAVVAVGIGLAVVGGFGLATSASDPVRTWSCTSEAKHSCAQWDGVVDGEALADHQRGCEQLGGVVSQSRCQAQNVVGTCIAHAGARTQLVYYSGRDVTLARQSCSMLGGTWH